MTDREVLYRVFTNSERTVYVRIWADEEDGKIEVATRASAYDTWGPPVVMTRSETEYVQEQEW